MHEIFINFFKYQSLKGQGINTVKSTDIYFRHAKSIIENSYSGDLSVSEIAKELGVSQVYLFKIFTERCGRSPKQYINEYRLNQAKALLEETSLSIREVAQAVGYYDSLAFSKFFSKHEKISPSDYRKRLSL